jgi:hypothetical protein
MDDKQTRALKRLTKKLSALRQTLSKSERELLDTLILGAPAAGRAEVVQPAEVEGHAMTASGRAVAGRAAAGRAVAGRAVEAVETAEVEGHAMAASGRAVAGRAVAGRAVAGRQVVFDAATASYQVVD